MQTFWMGLLLTASMQGPESAKAEKLFQAMANTLTTTKTLQCSFAIAIELNDRKGRFNGRLAFAEGNKYRLEADGDFFGNKLHIESISDGMKMKWTMGAAGQPPQSATGDVPPKANEFLRESMARSGVFIGLFPKPTKKAQPEVCDVCLEQNKKAEEIYEVSNFKLGGKEMLGKREIRQIEYRLTIDKQDQVAVTVWLDTENNLPLKRQLAMSMAKEQLQMVETCTDFRINELIDAKEFAVPK
jgi:outer membrane lipoprotein-sorting protein